MATEDEQAEIKGTGSQFPLVLQFYYCRIYTFILASDAFDETISDKDAMSYFSAVNFHGLEKYRVFLWM
jgi:hypothetical protein